MKTLVFKTQSETNFKIYAAIRRAVFIVNPENFCFLCVIIKIVKCSFWVMIYLFIDMINKFFVWSIVKFS